MRYAELRQKLRAQGFINAEIAALHAQYLMVNAAGLDDDEIIFDRDHGLLFTATGRPKYAAMEGVRVAPDTQHDCVYIMHDDGTAIKRGPF